MIAAVLHALDTHNNKPKCTHVCVRVWLDSTHANDAPTSRDILGITWSGASSSAPQWQYSGAGWRLNTTPCAPMWCHGTTTHGLAGALGSQYRLGTVWCTECKRLLHAPGISSGVSEKVFLAFGPE